MVSKTRKKKPFVSGQNPVNAAQAQGNIGDRGKILSDPDRLEIARARARRAGELGTPVLDKATGDIAPSVEESAAQEVAAREAQAQAFLEEKQFSEETLPKRVELNTPQLTGVEALPVVGPSLASDIGRGLSAAGQGIPALTQIQGIPVTKEDFGVKDDIELQTLLQNPQTAREVALQQIQQDVIDKGTTSSEKFGSIVEGIPIVGSLAAKFAGRMIEDPAGNVQTLVTEIQSERERASVLAEKAATGKLGDPQVAFQQIEDIEDNMFRIEQRIKLLSLESAVLRANADELNRIEEVILRSKERVFIAKQAAAAGMVAPATDSNIFLTLKDLQS